MSPFATYPSLIDRHVFISGGATGIGAALVEHFARQGGRVSFVDIDEANGKALADALGVSRHQPQYVTCDVTDLAALKSAIDAARALHGPIGVLVNNAANDVRHAFDTTTPQHFDRNIAVNLRHHYFATQAVRDDMRQLGEGSVICLGSTG